MNVIEAAKKMKKWGGVIRQKGWGPEQYIECPDKTYYLLWTNGVQSARATPTLDDLLAEYEWSAAPPAKPPREKLTPADYRSATKFKAALTEIFDEAFPAPSAKPPRKSR